MNNFKFWVKQNTPAILIGFGIVNSAAAIVLACFATKKATTILDPAKVEIVNIHTEMDPLSNDDPRKNEFKTKLKKVYFKVGKKMVMLYSPVAISFALSVTSIIFSHKMLRSRNLAIAAAFTTLKTGYDAYRGRVRDQIGDENEQAIYEGSTITKITEKDENGKKKVSTVITPNTDRTHDSDFSVVWGPGQRTFDSRSAGLNVTSIIQAEQWFNQKLKVTGYIFLNEVYEYLGFTAGMLGPRKLQASHVVGWLYCPGDTTRDNYVSFGIHDKDGKLTEGARNMQSGLADFLFLTFNVDGDILTEDNGAKAFMRIAARKDS